MPPKTVFSRDAVLEAGFQVLRKRGLQGLTSRNVARELDASVMPVYSSFGSMRQFVNAVIGKARDLMLEYASRPHTDMVFLNMGVGIAKFARDEPAFFRAMFLERGDFKGIIDEFLATLCDGMRQDPMFAEMPHEARMALLMKMWVYTHGLASLICVGVVDDTSDAFIVSSLRGVGRIVSGAALAEHRGERAESGGRPQPPRQNRGV